METKIITSLKWIGLGFFEPLIKLLAGKEPAKNGKLVFRKILLPIYLSSSFLGLAIMGHSTCFISSATEKLRKPALTKAKLPHWNSRNASTRAM
jgi:nitrate/nitrite transport system permease protein